MKKKKMMRACAASLLLLLALVACTTQDIQEPATEKKVESEIVTVPYTLHVAVRTTDTKVSVDADSKYQFDDGDVIELSGKNRDDVSGSVTYNKTKGEFTGQISYSKDKGDQGLVLIGTTKGKGFAKGVDYGQAVAADMKEAVQLYSVFSGEFPVNSTSASLYQTTSFLAFTLTFSHNEGMDLAGASVSVMDGKKTLASGKVDIKGGVASFVVAQAGGTTPAAPTVELCGKSASFTGTELKANSRYQVKKTLNPAIGDAYYSDGVWGSYGHAQKSDVIGIVVSTGAGVPANCVALVMALNEAGSAKWSTESKLNCGETTGWAEAFVDVDGPGKTKILAESKKNTAAVAVTNYSPKAPASSTGWFLPAIGQWIAAIEETGETEARNTWINGNGDDYTKLAFSNVVRVKTKQSLVIDSLNDLLKTYGGTALTEDSNSYWSASEVDASNAVRLNFSIIKPDQKPACKYTTPDCSWIKLASQPKSKSHLVRPFLAF